MLQTDLPSGYASIMLAISRGHCAGRELLTSGHRSILLIEVMHTVANTAESKQKEGRFESDALRNKRWRARSEPF